MLKPRLTFFLFYRGNNNFFDPSNTMSVFLQVTKKKIIIDEKCIFCVDPAVAVVSVADFKTSIVVAVIVILFL